MVFFAKNWVTATESQKIKLLKLWFYTIEFGLVIENNEIKAFGGGVITSIIMMDKFVNREIEILNYDYLGVLKSSISLSGEPECLFVFDSIPHANKYFLEGIQHVNEQ